MVIKRLAGHLKSETGIMISSYDKTDHTGALPHIVYQVNDQYERLALNGGIIQTDYLVELDVYTKTYKESEELKEKIVNALLNFERPVTSIKCDTEQDDNTKAILLTIEFEFFV